MNRREALIAGFSSGQKPIGLGRTKKQLPASFPDLSEPACRTDFQKNKGSLIGCPRSSQL
jgi:hypothetical protein